MNINASVTLLMGEDGLRIEIKDNDAHITFFRGQLSATQLCQALGRLANVGMVEAEVYGLDNLGKKQQVSSYEFALPNNIDYSDRVKIAKQIALDTCPDGWESDQYFSSQDSFFSNNGVNYARVTIRRWVDKDSTSSNGDE